MTGRTLMARGGVECWFSGGGVSAAAMDIRNSDDPLYEDPIDDDVISRAAFRNVPEPLIRMSRSKMNKLFAGYEGDPGDLGAEMMKRCSSVLFLAGHYAMRSPLCLQQLNSAVDAGIPITVCNIFAGIMPDFMEDALQGATFVDFVPSFMPATIERGQASFENSFEEMVQCLRKNEKIYTDELPGKMSRMIGEDADAFALEQVDGKFFVLLSHGGKHREFATTMKMELEQNRLWSFVSHQDEHMDRHQRARFHKAMTNCMVYCPIISPTSLESPELLAQIQMADSLGKAVFPIVLSSMKIPKSIRNPIGLLRKQAFVFHCHNGDESGAINFRINFEHLTRVVRARVSEAAILVQTEESEGSKILAIASAMEKEKSNNQGNQGNGPSVAGSPVKAARASPKKNISRYQQLHQRVQHQQHAMVDAQEALSKLKQENELMKKQLKNSKNITGELLCCVEYYRTKTHKYHDMLYPPPAVAGEKKTPGQVRLGNLKRELARCMNTPPSHRRKSIISNVLHEGVPFTYKNLNELEILLMKEIDKVEKFEGSVAFQRVWRGKYTRDRLYQELLVRSAIVWQSRFRGYRTRKKLVWET